MSSNRDLESRIADFYAQEGLLRAPDRVLSAALTTIETTKQRRVLSRVLWGFPRIEGGGAGSSSTRPWSGTIVLVLLAVLLTLLAATAVFIGARLLDTARLPNVPGVRGTFDATGSLATARSTHIAVLLADGRILILGGDTLADRWSLPAEAYDPATGTFSQLDESDPGLNRGPVDDDGFSATLLTDGRVLIAGGWDGNNFVDPPWIYERAAVLFDPDSGATRPTGSMNTGRSGHVAIRLPDGRVLIVGGTGMMLRDGSMEAVAAAEIYDPVTETFSDTGALSCPRSNDWPFFSILSAVPLPSGRILVTGGNGSNPCPFDEIYDPATGLFESVRTAGPREADQTVIFEGSGDRPGESGRVVRYDLATGTATDISPGPDQELERVFGPDCRDFEWECVGNMTATQLVDGRFLFAGGEETVIAPDSRRAGAWCRSPQAKFSTR